jgi:hypothetical protein
MEITEEIETKINALTSNQAKIKINRLKGE